MTSLELGRDPILAFRRRSGGLDHRRPLTAESLRLAAWAGLQDSMPRAALLSIHARVEGADPQTWAHPSLVQTWGPRFQTYVTAAEDLAVFSLSRLPDHAKGQARARETAAALRAHIGDGEVRYGDAGTELKLHHSNSLRYGAQTGEVLIRWLGARQPTVRMAPPPRIDALEARAEAVRRFVHVFGPGEPGAFGKWLGISKRSAAQAFAALEPELLQVSTPLGERWMLAADEESIRAAGGPSDAVRLLPSGDAYYLLWDAERTLLVPDAARRAELWTSRVWPGAVLIGPEIRGTWRRAHDVVSVSLWGRASAAERAAIEAEAASLPLPSLDRPPTVSWDALTEPTGRRPPPVSGP